MRNNLVPRAKWLARDDEGTVWSIGVLRYPASSVWAGREQFVKLRNFATMEEARAAHPRLPIEGMPLFDCF